MKPTQALARPLVLGIAKNGKAKTHGERATKARAGLTTVTELYRTLVDNGRWWMFPMTIILGLTSVLLVAIAALEYVAPFVYTIF